LAGFDRRDELDRRYAGEPGIFAPLGQSGGDFIENDDTGHDWRAWKMPGKAGMIGANYAASFEGHFLVGFALIVGRLCETAIRKKRRLTDALQFDPNPLVHVTRSPGSKNPWKLP
jgi:hypothetical protein